MDDRICPHCGGEFASRSARQSHEYGEVFEDGGGSPPCSMSKPLTAASPSVKRGAANLLRAARRRP